MFNDPEIIFNQINSGHTLLDNNMIFLAKRLLVPEPSSLVLHFMGMLALMGVAR
jgi:hypothetical protein